MLACAKPGRPWWEPGVAPALGELAVQRAEGSRQDSKQVVSVPPGTGPRWQMGW